MATAVATRNDRALSTWEAFESEMEARAESLAAILPSNVSKDRFKNSVVAAIKQTPNLLRATPRSLMAAITKSAHDGLVPDGREGVITVYREKQRDGSHQEVAQWNPMTFGLRKRARELDGIIIDAQVVHENDHFLWHQGDDPQIDHVPAALGTPRGEMIGAYAIFRARDGAILHREVMEADQIERVRAQSKQPNGLLWTKFAEEAWRKTVVRRGIKSVPCSEPLTAIVQRDDDLFDLELEPDGATKKREPARVVQSRPSGEQRPLPPVVGQPTEDPPDGLFDENDEAVADGAPSPDVEDPTDA